MLERVGRLVQLDLGLADRLALLGDEDRHELVDVRLEGLRARVDDLAAVGVAEPAPSPLNAVVRGLHRAVGVLRRRVRDATDQLARARVRDLAMLAGQRFGRPGDEGAVLDQGLGAHRVSSPRLTMLK